MKTPDSHDDTRRESGDDGDGQGAEDRGQSLSFRQVVGSTLAAAFGVQSSRNRERDFTRGKPIHFIVAGIVFTVLFVLGLALVVSLVS